MSSCTDTSLKIIVIVFVLEINTGDVGGFLQVQHYWGVKAPLGLKQRQTAKKSSP